MYSIPAPGTSSPEQFRRGAACVRQTRGRFRRSVSALLMRGTEHPVSRRARMVYWAVLSCKTIVVIGLLPQSGFSVDFSGEARFPAVSFLCCLSCDVPALGSSGPFRFREVPHNIGKVLGCGVPRPFKNLSRRCPRRSSFSGWPSRLMLLPSCCHPRF